MGLLLRRKKEPQWLRNRRNKYALDVESNLQTTLRSELEDDEHVLDHGRIIYVDDPAAYAALPQTGALPQADAYVLVTSARLLLALTNTRQPWRGAITFELPRDVIHTVEVSESRKFITITTRGYMGPLVPSPSNPHDEAVCVLYVGTDQPQLLEALASFTAHAG